MRSRVERIEPSVADKREKLVEWQRRVELQSGVSGLRLQGALEIDVERYELSCDWRVTA